VTPRDTPPQLSAARGLYFLALSVACAVSGVFITFSVNHAPTVGLIGLIIAALGSAIARVVAVAAVSDRSTAWRVSHAVALAFSIVTSVLAGVALLTGPTLGLFTLLVATWAGAVAVCDILLSINAPDKVVRRDFRVIALAGVVLAVVEVAVPLSSVYAVGILGAFGVVVSVYAAIAGMTLRFDAVSVPPEGKRTP